jgi:hypothetical protein
MVSSEMTATARGDRSDEEIRRIVDALEARIADVVSETLERTYAAVGSYEQHGDAKLRSDHRRHTEELYQLLVAVLREGRTPSIDDFDFTYGHAARRVQHGIALADFLEAFRIGQRTVWEALLDAAGDSFEGHRASRRLVAPLMDFINVGSTAAAQAFLDAERLLTATGDRARRDLLDDLLIRHPPAAGPKLVAARSAGLQSTSSIVVVSAVRVGSEGEHQDLRRAATVLAGAAQVAAPPLAVVRHDEIVIVASVDQRGVALPGELETSWRRFADHGLRLALGISTIHVGLSLAPEAYEEALAARQRMEEAGGGVLALVGLKPIEYVALFADATISRLIRQEVVDFVETDRARGGALMLTLREYVAAGLEAKLAAERLHIHVNTAQYRLRRISAATGCDLRQVSDVFELLVAGDAVARRTD